MHRTDDDVMNTLVESYSRGNVPRMRLANDIDGARGIGLPYADKNS